MQATGCSLELFRCVVYLYPWVYIYVFVARTGSGKIPVLLVHVLPIILSARFTVVAVAVFSLAFITVLSTSTVPSRRDLEISTNSMRKW